MRVWHNRTDCRKLRDRIAFGEQKHMVTTYLDELPFGDEDFIRAELNKNGRERRKLPEGCREQVLLGDIMRIAWPSMVELFLASLVGMADMIMVGAMQNGDDAISAVSLANQPKFMFVTLIMALNVGVTAAVARARGAGRHELAGDILRQGLLFSLLISLMASVMGLALARPLILFMANDGLEKNVIDMSCDYLIIQMAGFVTMGISSTYTAALRGTGNTKIPMIYNIMANLINIFFNYLLIYGHGGFPAMGVRGASIATVIGQLFAMVFAIIANGSGKYYFAVRLTDFLRNFHTDRVIIRQIADVGLPNLGEQLILRVGIILFSRQVSALGQPYYATHNICMNIQSMSFMLGQAMATSSTSLVGQSLGKKRPDMAEHYSRRCVRIGTGISVLLGLLFMFCSDALVGLYSSTPEILQSACPVMLILGALQPVQTIQFILSGSLRGAGDTKTTAVITMIGILALRPALAGFMIYTLDMGLLGAWAAIAADQIVRTVLVAIVYHRGRWKAIQY